MDQTSTPPAEPAVPRPRQLKPLSSTQVMFAVILAVGLMLAVNFSSRIVADRSLREVQQTVIQEIEDLKQEQADLVQHLEYAKSDAYVEAWAHSEGKMVREGEVLVFPVPSTYATPIPVIINNEIPVQTTLPRPENWQVWWSLFFDTEPPDF
jgi:cell division protein FtsB